MNEKNGQTMAKCVNNEEIVNKNMNFKTQTHIWSKKCNLSLEMSWFVQMFSLILLC